MQTSGGRGSPPVVHVRANVLVVHVAEPMGYLHAGASRAVLHALYGIISRSGGVRFCTPPGSRAVISTAGYISQSGRRMSRVPSASITTPLRSFSPRPALTVSLRLPSAITAIVTSSASSAM
jgi:hypothetical protein